MAGTLPPPPSSGFCNAGDTYSLTSTWAKFFFFAANSAAKSTGFEAAGLLVVLTVGTDGGGGGGGGGGGIPFPFPTTTFIGVWAAAGFPDDFGGCACFNGGLTIGWLCLGAGFGGGATGFGGWTIGLLCLGAGFGGAVVPAPAPPFFIWFLFAIIIAIILFPVGGTPPSSGFCRAGDT